MTRGNWGRAAASVKRALVWDIHITRLVALAALWLLFLSFILPLFSSFNPERFFRPITYQTIFAQFPEFGLMSLGVMLCMITGGIDLSVVGVANFTGILTALFLKWMDADGLFPAWGVPAALFLGVVVGAGVGAFNGVLVSKVRIPPILATLGTYELINGVSTVITGGKALDRLPQGFTQSISGAVGGFLPAQLIVFALVAAVIGILLTKTGYGAKIYLIGTSERAARFSGLKNDRLLIVTYLVSGVCAALGGLVMLGSYGTVRPDTGTVYTLQCVLIVVLGGVSPTGGKGKLTGVLLSILVLQLLSSSLNRIREMSSFYIPLIWGGVLILVMVLDYFTDKGKSRA